MSLREQLRTELMAIHDEHGRLTPEIVVDAARPEDHPLHDRFEWDNEAAGDAYRREQARQLIRSVRVVYREATEMEEARTVRAFHAIRDEQGSAYRPNEEVVASEFLTELLLRDMQREWKQLHRRWGHFAEFVALVKGDLGSKQGAA